MYLLPGMIHGCVRRPLLGPGTYLLFTTMKAEGDSLDPVKLAQAPSTAPTPPPLAVIYYWPFQGGT